MTTVYVFLTILMLAVGWLLFQVKRLTRVIKIARDADGERVRVGFDDDACLTVSRYDNRDSEITMKTSF